MVQSLTPFRHLRRESTSPLEGVCHLDALRAPARALGLDAGLVDALLELTERLFAGRLWAYHPIDLRYHDLAHTVQASYCWLDMAAGYAREEGLASCPREFALGFAAILLHDTGFLRAVGDDTGTGAKYTHCHVLRSCALAASLLPPLGFSRSETDDVFGMIRCTGLTGNPDAGTFSTPLARICSCMVATADYVGQMAAPDYPEKLRYLFSEFEEADDFANVPKDKRMFRSSEHLLGATQGFWTGFVRPKLENEFAAVHRYLAVPAPDRRHPYMSAIELNLVRIAASLTAV